MENHEKIILFDLDGTLIDPKLGITKSVQYALKKMNVVENDLDKLECFIGPPLQESFASFYHFDPVNTQLAIDYYRERYTKKGIYENIVYTGIPELLKALTEQHYCLALATSKPTVYAKQILRHFHIDQYFNLIVGSNLDGTRTSKTEIITTIFSHYKKNHLSDFIMIGDRNHDLIGAKNTGIASIGVTYGYGTAEEIQTSHPTYIVNSVKELEAILLKDLVTV